jgi:hypothetical protein
MGDARLDVHAGQSALGNHLVKCSDRRMNDNLDSRSGLHAADARREGAVHNALMVATGPRVLYIAFRFVSGHRTKENAK